MHNGSRKKQAPAKMTLAKLVAALVSAFLLVACSTHGFFISELQFIGSQAKATELSIPSIETRGTGDVFSLCKASVVQAPPIHISHIRQRPSVQEGEGESIVVSIQVFICRGDLLTNQLRKCDTEEDVEKICGSRVLLSELRGSEVEGHHNPQTPYWANAVLLRVTYNDKESAETPLVAVKISQQKIVSETSKMTSPLHTMLTPWNTATLSRPVIQHDSSWKLRWTGGKIGQVSGVALLDDEFVFVFHRGDRFWGAHTFGPNYEIQNKTAIDVDTILKCKTGSGRCVSAMGKDEFLLPHGISVTPDREYLLVTDVGRHQVIAKRIEDGKDVLTLGTFGIGLPGDEPDYFCQPADAEMDSETGLIFVADGYCNARVAVFNNDGSFNSSFRGCFGEEFFVVHDLAIDHKNRILFAADRENKRICVYSIDVKTFGNELDMIQSTSNIYAVDYNPGFLYTAEMQRERNEAFGTVTSIYGEFSSAEQFSDSSMRDPHDLSAKDNTMIFISDLKAHDKVFKFIRN